MQVALKHRDFKEPVQVDAQDRRRTAGCSSGRCDDIVSGHATGPEGTAHTWTLPTDRHTYRTRPARQGRGDGDGAVPRHGREAEPRRPRPLRECAASTIRADKFDALAIKDGSWSCAASPPGTTTCG